MRTREKVPMGHEAPAHGIIQYKPGQPEFAIRDSPRAVTPFSNKKKVHRRPRQGNHHEVYFAKYTSHGEDRCFFSKPGEEELSPPTTDSDQQPIGSTTTHQLTHR